MASGFLNIRGAIKNLAVAGGGFGPLFNQFMGINDNTELGFPNTDSGLKDAYLASLLAARCIRIRAKALAGIPMVVKDFQDNIIEDPKHPDYQWSYVFGKRANRTLYLLETQLLIWGKAFIRPHLNARRKLALHLLNPQTMEVKADAAGMLGFIQRIDGQISGEWEPDELIYFYDFNPDDDLGGRSPTAWALDTIATDIGIEFFVKTFFENDATPGGLLSTVENMQDADAQRYAAWWKKVFGGANNAHKTAVLGKGLTYQQVTPNIKDMDVSVLDERTKRRITLAYDVPMTIAGMDDAANYSTAQIQWRGFYTETVLPQADYIFDTVNAYIEDHGGRCYVEPNKDKIEALQEDRTQLTNQATTGLSGSVLSINEARKMLNQTELKTDWFIIPTIGLVKREDLEKGEIPQTTWETMPSQVPSGMFSNLLNPPPAVPQVSAPQAPQKAVDIIEAEPAIVTTATAANVIIQSVEPEPAPLIIEQPKRDGARDLYIQDLKNWSKKVATKGITAPFHPDYLPSAYADFLRIDLAYASDPKAVFTKAIEAFKQVDDALPTPEEFQAYWDGIGALFETMETAAASALDTLKGQIASALRSGNTDALPAMLEQFDAEQLATWLGTAEAPGALTQIVLAGAARGNDLLNNARLSANPLKAALDVGIAWDVVNEQAVEWARKFGSEQVRYINDTTRNDLNAVVANWVENGGSLDELADAIEGKLDAAQMTVPEGMSPERLKWLTSPERAHLIAQTMTTDAFTRGVEEKWSQAGVTEVKFRTQNDTHVCPLCKRLNNTIGTIAKGFYDAATGKWYTIAVHPGCRCFEAPVV